MSASPALTVSAATVSALTVGALAAGFFLLLAGTASALEEPAYDVLERTEDYEVRRYAPYIVAETVVEGGFEDAGTAAFRRLFGYISGKNRRSEKMAMTAPVNSKPSEKIAMTVPVLSAGEDERGEAKEYVYQFIMPSEYSLETLPEPADERVVLREVPEKTVAVLRYSGRSNKAGYERHEEQLLAALEADGVDRLGEPFFARYNGPFTPWFLRRNEVMVAVER